MDVLWACFGLTGLIFSGTVTLTTLFFPRLNLLSYTKILLLYLTVPYVMFGFISLGNCKY